MTTPPDSTLSRLRKWWSSATANEAPTGPTLSAQAAPAVGVAPARLASHGASDGAGSLAVVRKVLRVLREGLRLIALCALGYFLGYWMLEVRSNLRTVANAVAAASHLPRSSSQAPASVIDRLQPESEGIAPADTDTDTDTDTDAFSEREMLKCLAGAEEIPQRAQGRLVCYREEMERLQEALRDEYTLLLVLSPLDQQVRIATSQQQWEANLASRCTTDRNGGKPGRPFMSGYQCRIDAIRGRIKALRETI